jgi:hypothetical protein
MREPRGGGRRSTGAAPKRERPSARPRPLWRIAEPTTTLTDVALAALTAAFGALLLRRGTAGGGVAVLLWGGALLTTSASALLGAAVHGFAPWLPPRRKAALWRATLVLIGLTDFLLVAAVAQAELGGAARTLLLALALAKLALFLARLRVRDDFAVAAADAGVALLAVLAVEGLAALTGSAPGAPWIVAGVLLSLAGAAAQWKGWGLHRHFNHNDLFHVVQMAAACLFFRGGMLM